MLDLFYTPISFPSLNVVTILLNAVSKLPRNIPLRRDERVPRVVIGIPRRRFSEPGPETATRDAQIKRETSYGVVDHDAYRTHTVLRNSVLHVSVGLLPSFERVLLAAPPRFIERKRDIVRVTAISHVRCNWVDEAADGILGGADQMFYCCVIRGRTSHLK